MVNIACGLDTRDFIAWIMVKSPGTIWTCQKIWQSQSVLRIRTCFYDKVFLPPYLRIVKEVKVRGKMLFIIEGLSMYLTAEENGKILKIIKDNFDNAYILMECLAKTWVKKEGIEKSIQQTGSKFVFGADHFEELGNMTEGYHKIKDDNILRGMELFSLAYRLFALLPIAKKVTQKILIFEKD